MLLKWNRSITSLTIRQKAVELGEESSICVFLRYLKQCWPSFVLDYICRLLADIVLYFELIKHAKYYGNGPVA